MTEKEICDYYLSGKTLKETVEFGKTTIYYVRKILKQNNIELRSKNCLVNKNFNYNYFNVIDNEEKAYFIGFIAADGCIHKSGNKLSFSLNIKDIEILEKFCELTNCGNKISKNRTWDKRTKKYYYSCSLQVTCKKLIENISKYGLTVSKTKDYIIKNIPDQYMKDLMRGLIDGDGCIDKRRVKIISTKENITLIKEWMLKNNIKTTENIISIKEENNVYCFYLYEDRFDFLDLIYSSNSFCLKRKYKDYLLYKDLWLNQCIKVKVRPIELYKNGTFYKKFNSNKECAKYLGIKIGSFFGIVNNTKKYKEFTFVVLDKEEQKRKRR
jgi:hypothetical protein